MKSLRAALAILALLFSQKSATAQDAPVVAVYDLEGILSESGQPSEDLFQIDLSGKLPAAMFHLSHSLGKAAKDENVKGVVVEIDQASLGLAQIEELRRLLKTVKDAGKDVWVYTDYFNNRSALLGSVATQFVMMPEGSVSFAGIYSESMYFKNMLDKIGVTAQVVHIGDFKSFGEQFYRTEPSEFSLEQSNELLDSFFNIVVDSISQERAIDNKKILESIDAGYVSPQELVKRKFVDKLLHRTDFVKSLRQHYGKNAKFEHHYEMSSLKGPKVDGLMDIIKLMTQSGKKRLPRKPYVAVVVMEGGITDASVAPVRKEFLRLSKEPKNLQGVVFRVNSPGGSALASEALWEAVDEFKEVTKIPVVVSMGGVAASGGYYISAGADHIFAEKGTVTGSIGVVGMKLVAKDMLDKLGITTHSLQRGQHAGAMSMTRAFTPEEESLVRSSMTEVYETFLIRVSDGRGDRLKEPAEKLAGGRVYAGEAALDLGLIDKIGGLTEAIKYISTKSDTESPQVILLPKPKNPMDALFAQPDDKSDEVIRVQAPNKPTLEGTLRQVLLENQLMDLLSPAQKKEIQTFLSQLTALQNENVLLLGSPIPTF